VGSKKIEVNRFFIAKFEREDEWGGLCLLLVVILALNSLSFVV